MARIPSDDTIASPEPTNAEGPADVCTGNCTGCDLCQSQAFFLAKHALCEAGKVAQGLEVELERIRRLEKATAWLLQDVCVHRWRTVAGGQVLNFTSQCAHCGAIAETATAAGVTLQAVVDNTAGNGARPGGG